MDRTIIEKYKAEEKEQSELLFKKLQALNLLYPPCEEFRKCLTKEIFLKSSQVAFHQIAFYLFRLIDPIEVKKRFYWPINDKKGEAHFRSSTVEYLKLLSEKHNLKWNINTYLFLVPGGMKFINFMLDFVSFVIQELTRQREKQLSTSLPLFTEREFNLKCFRRKSEILKAMSSAYISELENLNKKCIMKMKLIRDEFETITSERQEDYTDIIEQLKIQFQSANSKLLNEKSIDVSTKIIALQTPLYNVNNLLQQFLIKSVEKKGDNYRLHQAIDQILQHFVISNDENIINKLQTDESMEDKLPCNILLEIFNRIYPSLEQTLERTNNSPFIDDFVKCELFKLLDESQELVANIMEIKKLISLKKQQEWQKAKTPMRQNNLPIVEEYKTSSTFMTKYVLTPPIKLDMANFNQGTRLPLLDEFHNKENRLPNSLLDVSRSARKPLKIQNESVFDLNSTVNRSRIIDPMHLLRTINKNTGTVKSITQQNQNNSSNCQLVPKWKTHLMKSTPAKPQVSNSVELFVQTNLQFHSPANAQNSAETTTSTSSPPSTPFNTNDITYVPRSCFLEKLTSVSFSYNSNNNNTKKLTAVKKVQNDSMNFQNLSTSPSGRLESLVPIDYILSNEQYTTNSKELSDSIPNKIESPLVLKSTSSSSLSHNKENIDISNLFSNIRIGNSTEETLFNISDSVLKDVML